MAGFDAQYCQGIAKVLEGEDLKMGCYIEHAQTRGVLRERFVAKFVRDATPGGLRVDTGFIRDGRGQPSKQCDLLIHAPCETPPLYRWEDLVVVRLKAAKAAIEVKSKINKGKFKEILGWHQSIERLRGPSSLRPVTFVYGRDGVNFGTFAEYVSKAISENELVCNPGTAQLTNVPTCMVVQDRHYLSVRARGSGNNGWYVYLVDFTRTNKEEQCASIDGMAIGWFLEVYRNVIQERGEGLRPEAVRKWFNGLPIKDQGKTWIKPTGEIKRGNVE